MLASSADPAPARPRRQDVCRIRLSERGADAQGGDQGRRRQGRVHDRRRSTPRPTRRCTRSAPTSRSRSAPGRASRRSPRDRPADLPVHRLRLPGLLPGRPRLRPRVARARAGRREAVRRGHGPRLRVRGGRARTPPPILVAGEPGRVRREPGPAARRAPGSSRSGGYLVDAAGQRRHADARSSGRATRASCTTRAC